MTDINLFKQYELAWSEFEEWYYGKDDFYYLDIEQDLPLLIVLAIFQQYLDGKGIYCEGRPEIAIGYSTPDYWKGYVNGMSWERGLSRFSTRSEALLSACIKGFEIRNNQLKDK